MNKSLSNLNLGRVWDRGEGWGLNKFIYIYISSTHEKEKQYLLN